MSTVHYWHRKPKLDIDKFMAFAIDCQKVLTYANIPLSHARSSRTYPGFEVTKGVINFNGLGIQAHETFYFERDSGDFENNFCNDGNAYGFCKTMGKPYDVCVTACLILAKIHFGDDIRVRVTDPAEVFSTCNFSKGAELVRAWTKHVFNLGVRTYKDHDGEERTEIYLSLEAPVESKSDPIDKEQLKKDEEDFKKSKFYDLIG